jgi:lysophospholipase L1-like esterase
VVSAGEVTVSGESVPASSEEELEGGKAYYWQAHYGGDTNNDESTSTCTEILNVQAKTSLLTTLFGESKEAEELEILEGAGTIAQASVNGKSASQAGGKVVYKIYSDKECKTLVAEAGEVTVTGGSIPTSTEEKLKAGTYYWQSTYSGDSNNQASTSACGKEVVTTKTTTSLTTSLAGEGQSGESVTVGEEVPVHDTATLSGSNASKASGTVKYDVYSDSECENLVAEAGAVTVTSGSVPASSEEKLKAGTYYWQATYSGDSNNRGSTSTCGSEFAVVTPPLTASLAGEGQSGEEVGVLEGSGVSGDATLRDEHAATAGGTVKYKVYSDKECKTLVAEAGEVTVTNGSIPASKEEKLKAGTYYWQASYSGDSKDPAATSTCGVAVDYVETSVSLTASLSGEKSSGEKIEVKEGEAVGATATLSGTNASTATGYLRYYFYSDSECKHLVAEAGDESVSKGSVPESSKETLPAGTYYWQEAYSGDGTNHSAASACGAGIAVVTAPVTTSLSGGTQSGLEVEVSETTAVTDVATLHGEHVSTASGTVKYDVYSDSECKHLVAEAGEVTVTKGGVPASKEETLSAGDYYWQATYSGDSEKPPASSTCGKAFAVVEPEGSQYAALGDSYSAGEGLNNYYSKTNTWSSLNKCHRSAKAYPARVAEDLYGASAISESEVLKQQPSFIFRACSGAVAENLWGGGSEGGQYYEWIAGPSRWLRTPAQDLWLELPGGESGGKPNPNITLVTLTVGGNDAGFSTVVDKCVGAAYVDRWTECTTAIKEWETGISSLTTKLPVVLNDIRAAAPNARIRVLLYPQPINTAVRSIYVNYGLYIENSPAASHSVAVALEAYVALLNQTISTTVTSWTASSRAPAAVIGGTVRALAGHQLGDAQPWLNGVQIVWKEESFHPNCQGQIAVAEQLVLNLGRPVPGGWSC